MVSFSSVAKDRDVKYTLVQLCGETSCLYHMYDVTALKPEGDNAPVVQSASVSKFHLSGAMPVQYVVGASYNYFVAWNFLVGLSFSIVILLNFFR